MQFLYSALFTHFTYEPFFSCPLSASIHFSINKKMNTEFSTKNKKKPRSNRFDCMNAQVIQKIAFIMLFSLFYLSSGVTCYFFIGLCCAKCNNVAFKARYFFDWEWYVLAPKTLPIINHLIFCNGQKLEIVLEIVSKSSRFKKER